MNTSISDIVIYDQPEYSRIEKDTHDPIILSTSEQQIIRAGTVLGRQTSSGKYGPLDSAATDGLEMPAAILLQTVVVPANTDTNGVAEFRHARIFKDSLIWPDGYQPTDIADALVILEASGIIAE